MSYFPAQLQRRFLGRAAVAVVLLAVLSAVAPAEVQAKAPPGPVASLKLVPQDASFYASMLRTREQLEIVAQSNFWKRLTELEIAREFWREMSAELTEPPSPFTGLLAALETPDNQQALDVLKDLFSEEVFVYGGPDLGETLVLFSGAVNAMRFEQMGQQISGAPRRQGSVQQLRAMLNVLNADLDKLKTPELVFAARLKNKTAAEDQLRRIEAYARVVPEQVRGLEKLRGKFKSQKLGDSQFLTLAIDELIPWDEAPFDQVAEEPGQYDKLRDKLKGMKMLLALGIHQDHVVLSLGKSLDHLAAWGKGPALVDHPRLKALRDKGAQRFTGVTFVSRQMVEATSYRTADFDALVAAAEALLPRSRLPAVEQKQILEDVRQVADALKSYLPKYDARLGFSYLTPRGIESQHYDWTEQKDRGEPHKLPILSHLGSNPILAVAMRSQLRSARYDLAATALDKGRGYFEKYAVPQMSRREKAGYQQFADIAWPLLARADKVNRELLLPALAEGQAALVVDGTLKAKQWHARMPATADETAIPMPAIVMGVADAARMDKALGEYRLIVNDLLTRLRPMFPDWPEIQLPPAEQKKQADGSTVYYFPLGDKLGLDSKLAPNSGLSKDFFVVSLSPRLTVKLLKPQPLAAADGPLKGAEDRSLSGAVIFDFPQLVDVVHPWINEGAREYVRELERALAFNAEGNGDEEAPAEEKPAEDSQDLLDTLAQVKQLCDLAKAFQGVTSATWFEGGAEVTHTEVRFQDVK
jgi:hypothetical protein